MSYPSSGFIHAPFYANNGRKRQRRVTAGGFAAMMFGGKVPQPVPQQRRPTVVIPPRGIGPVIHIHQNDVLAGRGGRINSHVGNVQFREIVHKRKQDYLAQSTKKLEKAHIAAEIVYMIRVMDPPGRFLKQDDDGSWWDIGDQKAIKKVGQALREDALNVRQKGVDEKDNEKKNSGIKKPQKSVECGKVTKTIQSTDKTVEKPVQSSIRSKSGSTAVKLAQSTPLPAKVPSQQPKPRVATIAVSGRGAKKLFLSGRSSKAKPTSSSTNDPYHPVPSQDLAGSAFFSGVQSSACPKPASFRRKSVSSIGSTLRGILRRHGSAENSNGAVSGAAAAAMKDSDENEAQAFGLPFHLADTTNAPNEVAVQPETSLISGLSSLSDMSGHKSQSGDVLGVRAAFGFDDVCSITESDLQGGSQELLATGDNHRETRLPSSSVEQLRQLRDQWAEAKGQKRWQVPLEYENLVDDQPSEFPIAEPTSKDGRDDNTANGEYRRERHVATARGKRSRSCVSGRLHQNAGSESGEGDSVPSIPGSITSDLSGYLLALDLADPRPRDTVDIIRFP